VSLHLGIDLGGTNIKSVVLSEGHDPIVARYTAPTEAKAGPDAVTGRIVAEGRRVMRDHDVETVGLGVPGLYDQDSGAIRLFPNLPGAWNGHPLRSRVSEGLGLPVTMINDARAFTLAEGALGAGRGARVVVAVVLGTGVGGGILIDGRLFLGAYGTAGEIAHQTIDPEGPMCGCGNRGCAEALTKADALASYAGMRSPEEVYKAAAAGDPVAIAAIDRVAGYLGIALANAVTLLGADRVIVGGGIASAGELTIGPIRRALMSRVTLVPTEELDVVAAELGPWAGAVGAALAGSDQPEVRAR
jgi:glucokinase